ncbi:Uu.00g080780.m01.CDS01 [Anthostomella pinea]|uniref:Uu.00g080780.m01.CDS01 n=1 Tax=Anthostomella pinea TaxID=933095 RepID=A0AAI8VLP5_9PEZI|nr:Uu.00g080780.m01.CDS01 [Anthostomella pinea]
MDPARPSLAVLGLDIISVIMDMLQDTSPSSVASMALEGGSDAAKRRLLQMEKQDLLPAIRSLTVDDNTSSRQPRDDTMHILCRLLPQMTGLRDLTWSSNFMPAKIRAALESCPSVRLHTRFDEYRALTQVNKPCNLVTLAGSRNLSSLQVVYEEERDEYCGLGFTGGEHPAALEELVLRHYPFGRACLPRVMGSVNYPSEMDEMDYWAAHFDWSRLRRLKTPSLQLVRQILPRLTALQDLSLQIHYAGDEVVGAVLLEVPASLTSITMPFFGDTTLQGILRHAKTLRKLDLHQLYDHGWDSWYERAERTRRWCQMLRDECSLVEELSLDVVRDGAWPFELLDTLASFPRLRQLDIWLQLGAEGSTTEPKMTFEAAAMLYKHLEAHGQQQGLSLDRIGFHSGMAWTVGRGYLTSGGGMGWVEDQCMAFVCMPSEREDERVLGRFTISCPVLSARDDQVKEVVANARAARLEMENESEMWQSLTIALDGPILQEFIGCMMFD